jgi:hypothetical protein
VEYSSANEPKAEESSNNNPNSQEENNKPVQIKKATQYYLLGETQLTIEVQQP